MRRIREGDSHAFAELVRRWQTPLLNLAYRFCRDRVLAEDMVQEAFLRVHRKLARFDERSKFSTWLFTVATRVFISEVRRTRPGWLFVSSDVLSRAESTIAQPDAGDQHEVVRRSVLALPEKYRNAILLYYFHDNDVEQAAATLQISPGTLKSRMHRGRALLKRRLAGRLGQAAVAQGAQ